MKDTTPVKSGDIKHGFIKDDAHLCRWEEPHNGDHRCAECGTHWNDDSDEVRVWTVGPDGLGGHDVILYRTPDGVMRCDLLTDSRVDEPGPLRELAKALTSAADVWEATK
ncbi:hypothetical protein ACIGB8_01170 [Promicromonospora sukumoe]|uniref:hypothetical protein n=1 Tax=Promicromonospora sukumoe TaxID=88382 RepID=UPI0037CA7E1D